MAARSRDLTASALVVFTVASLAADTQEAPPLHDVLRAAGAYVAQYTEKLTSGIAAEETSLQFDVSSGQVRGTVRVTSDIVFAGLADGIEGFRDVVAIDNAPLRPRDDRLPSLLRQMVPAALEQARAWSAESVERYISPNLHALDQPLLALEFLREEHQERSAFKIDSVKTSDGVQVAVLRFSERGRPRLVPTAGDAAAGGRAWIDVATGIVRQTEIGITDDQLSVRASVKYALDPGLGLWVPVEMFQQFDASGTGSGGLGGRTGSGGGYAARQSLEGRAKYAKFRRLGTPASLRQQRASAR